MPSSIASTEWTVNSPEAGTGEANSGELIYGLDDKAPVEQVIHGIIIQYLLGR